MATEINDRLAAPYSSICYIQCLWPDGSSTRASGVVVGYNDVLTALHVVYDVNLGGWASSIQIIPAADTQPWREPYGEFTSVGSVVGRAATWDTNGDGLLTQAESAGDLALIGMTVRIGDVTGWLPVKQVPNDFSGVMVGYPASGTGMMAQSAFADASSTYGVYSIDGSLGAGASGGPLLQTVNGITSVAGVLSSGNTSGTSSTYAGLFTADTWSWLQSAMGANDGLLGNGVPSSVVTPTGTIYTGSAGNDSWTGTAGWDTFTGYGGNDVVDGAVGVDTAVFSASRVSYAVSVSQGVVTVADGTAGRDGTDTLHNVERVKFSDVSVAFDVYGSAGQAYRLYQAAFDRAPDVPGLGFQMRALDDGLSLSLLAGNFLQSPEFAATYGSLDNTQFVTQLYQNVLHRAPDQGGLAYHVNDLTANGYSRADVLTHFSESPENQAALIGVMQNGMTYTV
jgi:V8-like Glu-specific endopeptidase